MFRIIFQIKEIMSMNARSIHNIHVNIHTEYISDICYMMDNIDYTKICFQTYKSPCTSFALLIELSIFLNIIGFASPFVSSQAEGARDTSEYYWSDCHKLLVIL